MTMNTTTRRGQADGNNNKNKSSSSSKNKQQRRRSRNDVAGTVGGGQPLGPKFEGFPLCLIPNDDDGYHGNTSGGNCTVDDDGDINGGNFRNGNAHDDDNKDGNHRVDRSVMSSSAPTKSKAKTKLKPPASSCFRELGPPGSNVWVLPNFLSPRECQAWIDFCETGTAGRSGSNDKSSTSSNNGNSHGFFQYTAHPATQYVAHRECHRLQHADATELAHRIFERIRDRHGTDEVLPAVQEAVVASASVGAVGGPNNRRRWKGYRPVTCNPNLRVYRYGVGHSFGRHVDEANPIPGSGGRTELTVLVYLSGIPEMTGGATRFYFSAAHHHHDESNGRSGASDDDRRRGTKRRGHRNHNSSSSSSPSSSSSSSSSFAYIPEVGSMLLHVHGDRCLQHEAEPVLAGTKYVLRTDLVFADVDENDDGVEGSLPSLGIAGCGGG